MKKDKKKSAADQPNLFGEQDQVYNTIQEEITIVVEAIEGCQSTIIKKEEQITALERRKERLDKAAETVAKIRNGALKKKEQKKKD